MTEAADMAVVERVLRETGVDTRVPAPGWSGWLEALAEAFLSWLREMLPAIPDFSALATSLGRASIVVLLVVVATIVYVVVRAAVMGARRRPPAATGPSMPPAAASPIQEHDRDGWKEQFNHRLATGDLAGALEALWWWFARSVCRSRVDPAWTSRELLAQCGRADLVGLAGVLDRLLYGVQRPTPDELQRFMSRAETALS
jgi:hypothetical protein